MLKQTLFCLCLAVLTGCAPLTDDHVAATRMDVPDLQSMTDAEARIKTWPDQRWWRQFRSPELNRLVDAALGKNPGLQIALARVSQSDAMVDTRAADMLPTLSSHVQMFHERFSANDFYGPINGGKTFTGAYIDPAVFSYHLDLWGKDRAVLEAAVGKKHAAEAELSMARLLLSGAVTKTYFRLCSVAEELALTDELADHRKDKLHLTQVRFDLGLDTKDAVDKSRFLLEGVHQQRIALEAEATLLRDTLSALAGEGPEWGRHIAVSEIADIASLALPEHLSLGLLSHRPDLAAALWLIEAEAQNVKIAKTRFYPDVDLVGLAGLRSLNLKDLSLSHGASVAYSIGPTVSLPLFEGGRLEAELSNQQAAYDMAVAAYNNTLLDAVQQVADAVAHSHETQALVVSQDAAIQANEAQARIHRLRSQTGLNARDGEVEAQFNVIEQYIKLSKLKNRRLETAVELITALGGGYEQPLPPAVALGERQ
ncbi:efflux transporter outer membrane subunit [Candidatus Methylospira mobilis]|uniref:Efflux transporter outer membrane subunit n=1 Tax=Candidatus Methylospira mobilis TaxID=1808979 RepID=A0A5Q0BJV3_9GAMM|nr:efflux transporter outer membrane subunit [Candidatus Methylospira mobilis]QFY44093.1 efflux transporter outer membrane subunit [Candidatus Methylospira mobilis]WNV06504.1 efflux transporter outer membrane subunit [Candidatus Methylospira mobilis]